MDFRRWRGERSEVVRLSLIAERERGALGRRRKDGSVKREIFVALLFSSQALRARAVPNPCVGASWRRPERGRERERGGLGGGRERKALTCTPRTAPCEHVDFRIPPGEHAVGVARRQIAMGVSGAMRGG